MNSEHRDHTDSEKTGHDLAGQVGPKAERKQRAREQKGRGLWFGLGMFGLIGWSVALPTLLFLALGVWMDGALDGQRSWTLIMLGLGVGVGCLNAWRWVRKNTEPD